MKIGILTHPIETNYGGILQAFALQKTLRDMGHDVLTIDRHHARSYPSFLRHALGYLKRLKQYYIDKRNDVSVCWDAYMADADYKTISQYTRQYAKKNIRFTRWAYTSELAKIDEEYTFDAYIVGSDQVWLPYYALDSFLAFVKRPHVVKIFYAASAGKLSWADDEAIAQACKELVKDFKAVSVREEALVNLAKERLGVDATHVLDPTLLLTPAEYMSTVAISPEKNVLFTYILDETSEKRKIVEAILADTKLKQVVGNVERAYVKCPDIDLQACVYPPLDNWLNGINNANFVITDSFHGTAFAILFNKPFIVVANRKRGIERFTSLLSMFSLEDRIVEAPQEALLRLKQPIDFELVNKTIDQWKVKSLSFLSENLKG